MGKITIFWRQGCPHCQRAKEYLTAKNIPYEGIDITNDERARLEMIYLSGKQTLPEIFFNEELIGGASDLLEMDEQVLAQKVQSTLAAPNPDFPPLVSDEMLESVELPIAKILDKYAVNPRELPDVQAVTGYVVGVLGTDSPKLYDYMGIGEDFIGTWNTVFLNFYTRTFDLAPDLLGLISFATSLAAGCSYCSAHAANISLDTGTMPDHLKQLFDFYTSPQHPTDDSVLPFSELERAVIRVSRGATLNTVDERDLQLISKLDAENAPKIIEAMGLTCAGYGYFNRFNDLLGVEIEGSQQHAIKNVFGESWDFGKHATEDDEARRTAQEAQSNADVAKGLEAAKVFLKTYSPKLLAKLGDDWKAYYQQEIGVVPLWIESFPDRDCQRAVANVFDSFYHRGEVSEELKNLMLYVLTKGSGHEYLRQLAAYLAYQAANKEGKSSAQAKERLAKSVDAAKSKKGDYGPFDEKECTALRYAQTATNYPPYTPSPIVLSLQKYYTPKQIVEMTMALSIAGVAQRWTAINKPPASELEVAKFFKTNSHAFELLEDRNLMVSARTK